MGTQANTQQILRNLLVSCVRCVGRASCDQGVGADSAIAMSQSDVLVYTDSRRSEHIRGNVFVVVCCCVHAVPAAAVCSAVLTIKRAG